MFTSGAIDTVAAEQSRQSAIAVDEPGVEMLRVVGGILDRATYGLDDVEALRSIVDDDVNAGDRRFARDVMRWLAQQSATQIDALWQRNGDAQH